MFEYVQLHQVGFVRVEDGVKNGTMREFTSVACLMYMAHCLRMGELCDAHNTASMNAFIIKSILKDFIKTAAIKVNDSSSKVSLLQYKLLV